MEKNFFLTLKTKELLSTRHNPRNMESIGSDSVAA
jgi:hypothetical protein